MIFTARNPEPLERAAREVDALSTTAFDATDFKLLEKFFDDLPPCGSAALPAMTRNLALELAPVRVNVIAAGFVDSPLSERLLREKIEDRRNQLRTTLPIRRVVEAADVAALAIHKMTNTALTGATYDIDGGYQLVSM
jgi:hypothetical protein